MKVQQFQLALDDLERSLAPAAAFEPQLVTLFGTPEQLSRPLLAPRLRQHLPTATLFGCTTARVVHGPSTADAGPSLTAIRFERVRHTVAAEPLRGIDDSFACGVRLAMKLPSEGLRTVVVLAPGYEINGSALIRGLNSTLPVKVPMAGGLASSDTPSMGTLTMCNERSGGSLVVALGLYGEALRFSHGSFGGWHPAGPIHKVTHCRGGQLFELDNEPALAVYARDIGDDAAGGLPTTGMRFPLEQLTSTQHGTGLMRALLGVDRDHASLSFAGDLEVGGYVRVMQTTGQSLIEGAAQAARTARSNNENPTLSFIVSCVGRRMVLGPHVQREVDAVAAALGGTPLLAGFYSNGEISSGVRRGEPQLVNQTMTVTCLGETA